MQATRAGAPPGLSREYAEGELLRYRMRGRQQTRTGSFSYEAESEGVVRRSATGAWFEDTRWVGLRVDGAEIDLSGSSHFRQQLSLDPSFEMPLPDIRGLHPRLIGPVFDLMTFYVDLRPDLRGGRPLEPGVPLAVAHGQPNSWADGTRVLVGQDAIDFELTLESVAPEETRLRVCHVPPLAPALALPAAWMQAPVAEHRRPNNWVQVVKVESAEGVAYVASVGSERFDVLLHIDPAGRILRATMDNPVEVLERTCTDPDLTACGDPRRYRIHRSVSIEALP